jgi:hypothetical protein
MNYSINPEEIKTEIKKLVHLDTYFWNIKQYRNTPLKVLSKTENCTE